MDPRLNFFWYQGNDSSVFLWADRLGAILEPNTCIGGGNPLCNDMKWRDQMTKNTGILTSVVLIAVHILGNISILVTSLHMARGEIVFPKDDLLDNVMIY